MEKVLVTGGGGFIGSHVVDRLISAGVFVTIIDDFRTGQPSNIARLLPGSFSLNRESVLSIGDYARSLADHRAVFHLAAEVGNIRSLENAGADAQTNILGTIAVCEFAKNTGAKIIYSSSSAIYGETARLPVSEDHPTIPLSPYGLSKLTGELYVRMYGRLHGISQICLRYFNAYGEGQLFNPYSNVIPIFVQKIIADEDPLVFGNGTQTRDFVHVKDLAEANFLAYRSLLTSGNFNVGSGVRSSLLDLVQILSDLHRPLHPQFMPFREGEVLDSVADISKARDALGYLPTISLRQGVSDYYQWRKKQVSMTGLS